METIELKGERQTYKVDFGTNAMCRLEEGDKAGRSCAEILDAILSTPSVRIATVRQLVQALLVEPLNPSLDETGAIIDDVGGPAIFILALRQSRHLQTLPSLDEPTVDPPTPAVN